MATARKTTKRKHGKHKGPRGGHRVAPHPASKRAHAHPRQKGKGKCPHCGAWHDRSKHESHSHGETHHKGISYKTWPSRGGTSHKRKAKKSPAKKRKAAATHHAGSFAHHAAQIKKGKTKRAHAHTTRKMAHAEARRIRAGKHHSVTKHHRKGQHRAKAKHKR